MIPLTLAQVADVVGGELDDAADGTRWVTSVVIDSRAATPGALFVALPGERVDGHEYARAAAAAGSSGHLRRADRPTGVPGGIAVDDPADALLGLGLWLRETVDPIVVMVTGSNGKTTTKDLIAAAVGARRRVVATTGSQNNELGLPLTCTRLEPDSEVLVAEVGMRGEGQIAALAGPMRPDVAVVTNVAGVHLELLGSLEAVARAKSELVQSLRPGGVAVLNGDDPRVAAMAGCRPDIDVVTYGLADDVDVRAVDVTLDAAARPRFAALDGDRRVDVRLAVSGVHNVGNALAALAVARLCEVDPADAVRGLETAVLSRWRMEFDETAHGIRILNDAYNANPDSTAAALRTLSAIGADGRRVAVLGYMAEIGPTADVEHRRVGRLAADLGVDGLVVVGRNAAALADGARDGGFAGAAGLHVVDDTDEAVAVLADLLSPRDVVLVKASRSAGLERVADGLRARLEADA